MTTLLAPEDLKKQFINAGSPVHSPRGTFLFHRGDDVAGVFLITAGAAKLGLDEGRSAFGQRKIGPGSVLGLPAAMSNSAYSLSAEIVEDSELVYLSREQLLNLLREKPELCMQVIEILTEELAQTRSVLEQTLKTSRAS